MLRRETAPLGVRVITVELGKSSTSKPSSADRAAAMVMTAMLRAENPCPLSLPDPSRSPHFAKWYSTISPTYRKDIEKRYPQAMSASKAAAQIVDSVEGGTSGKIWVGTMAWVFRCVWPFMSTWRQDKINSDLLHMEMLVDKTN